MNARAVSGATLFYLQAANARALAARLRDVALLLEAEFWTLRAEQLLTEGEEREGKSALKIPEPRLGPVGPGWAGRGTVGPGRARPGKAWIFQRTERVRAAFAA